MPRLNAFFPFLTSRLGLEERIGKFSPDGQWIVYCSDRTGEVEVYARRFPDGGERTKISTQGGTQPRWNRNGKELYYVEHDTLISVPVNTEGSFTVGTPERLFQDGRLMLNIPAPNYDVSPDSEKFVLVDQVKGDGQERLVVVQNWHEEFRDLEQD